MRRRHSRQARSKGGENACAQALESRLLFSDTLDINGGLLTYVQAPNTSPTTLTVTLDRNTGMYEFAEGEDNIVLGQGAINAGVTLTPVGFAAFVPDTSVFLITIDSADSAIKVESSDAPVDIHPSAISSSSTVVTIGGGVDGAQHIAMPVNVQNVAGLTIDDSNDATAPAITMNGNSVTGAVPGGVSFDSAVRILEVDVGLGNSVVNVDGTPTALDPSSPAKAIISTINQDEVNVRSVALNCVLKIQANGGGLALDDVLVSKQGSVEDILGGVSITNPDGLSRLTLDDSADPVPLSSVLLQTVSMIGAITNFGPGGFGFDPMSLTNLTLDLGTADSETVQIVEGLSSPHFTTTVNGGAGSTRLEVGGTPATSILVFNGHGRINDVQVNGGGSGFAGLQGDVELNNLAGVGTLTFDDNGFDDTARAYSLTDTSMTGGAAGMPIHYSNFSTVTVYGTAARDDGFNVVPSGLTTFSIFGNFASPAPSFPGDTLMVDTSGTSGAGLSLTDSNTGKKGTFTFADRQPVNFERLGSVSPLIGSISGNVFNAQNGTPLAGVTVFIDEGSFNGMADPGEPTAVTDASGAYALTGLLAGTYPVEQQDLSGFSVFGGISIHAVEVKGGQDSGGIDFSDAPAEVPGAPNLRVLFNSPVPSAVISGSKGKIKLRITDETAAVAAGSTQVQLFASLIQHLSPNDVPFATISTGALKLRAGGSKLITANVNYPSGIADENYFILASIDPANAVAESDEPDNVTASGSTVAISPSFVDLTGTFGAPVPASIGGVKPATVPVVVGNIGNTLATGSIAISIFASTDATFDAGDTLLTRVTGQHINLKPGQTHVLRLRVATSAGLAPGKYFLTAFVNSDQALVERNTANDQAVSATSVSLG